MPPKEKTPLLDQYKSCLDGNASKQAAVIVVDELFGHLAKQSDGSDKIQIVLTRVGEFKKARSGWFGGSADKEQEKLLLALDNSIGEALLVSQNPKFTRENLRGAIFVLMKNASGSATIPQALQGIFDKYKNHFKAQTKGSKFIKNNMTGSKGSKYLNPNLPDALLPASLSSGSKPIGDVTTGENLSSRYLASNQGKGNEDFGYTTYEIFRYNGGVYAWDGSRAALLWESAKHISTNAKDVSPEIQRTIGFRGEQIATGSMGVIHGIKKNPNKIVKTLNDRKGRDYALYNGYKMHDFNNSLIRMKYACIDNNIEETFKIGLWNLKNGYDSYEDITYNMPRVKGKALYGQSRAQPRQLMDQFSVALYKLNMAGFYHPDLIVCGVGTQVSDQNLIKLNDVGPIVAIDIDCEVRAEKCPQYRVKEYGYNLKDQWLVWCLYISSNSIELYKEDVKGDYENALSDSPGRLVKYKAHIPQGIIDLLKLQ